MPRMNPVEQGIAPRTAPKRAAAKEADSLPIASPRAAEQGIAPRTAPKRAMVKEADSFAIPQDFVKG